VSSISETNRKRGERGAGFFMRICVGGTKKGTGLLNPIPFQPEQHNRLNRPRGSLDVIQLQHVGA
jgi:hypothetical protein